MALQKTTTIIATLFLLLGGCANASDFTDHMKMAEPPRTMPPLVFEDSDGAQHTLAEYHGRFILLNIWASWCAPCVQEMPSLEKLQAQLNPRRVVVIPLSEDRNSDAVTAFYKIHGLTKLPVAVDHAGLAPAVLNLGGLPTTLLINPQGIEVARMEGDTDWSSPEAIEAVNAMTGP